MSFKTHSFLQLLALLTLILALSACDYVAYVDTSIGTYNTFEPDSLPGTYRIYGYDDAKEEEGAIRYADVTVTNPDSNGIYTLEMRDTEEPTFYVIFHLKLVRSEYGIIGEVVELESESSESLLDDPRFLLIQYEEFQQGIAITPLLKHKETALQSGLYVIPSTAEDYVDGKPRTPTKKWTEDEDSKNITAGSTHAMRRYAESLLKRAHWAKVFGEKRWSTMILRSSTPEFKHIDDMLSYLKKEDPKLAKMLIAQIEEDLF